MSTLISDLMESSHVKFGTSGARGKVSQLSAEVCYAYTMAFLQHLDNSRQLNNARSVATAGDLRQSTPQILSAVHAAIADFGLNVDYCGLIPSPAVAYYGMEMHIPAIMVTGSHIPDDRNGIKFNTALGEITKDDEIAIKQIRVDIPNEISTSVLPTANAEAASIYRQRAIDFFPANCLSGLNIMVYQHSSVARDILADLLDELGANVIKKARSEKFMPVDTEAIRPEDVALAKQWATETEVDAIVSTDGDADRPLVSDHKGNWLRGDILGVLVSQYLSAEAVATPVSSNTALEKCGQFKSVSRTKIGSPFVIAAMKELKKQGYSRVVGYEANGGFLTETVLATPAGQSLAPLPTRDCVLPIVALLHLATQKNKTIEALLASLPERFTASDRLKEYPTEQSKALIEKLTKDADHVASFLGKPSTDIVHTDCTDGLRITLKNDDIVHFRPSGNAPEFRCYVESSSEVNARALLEFGMSCILKSRNG